MVPLSAYCGQAYHFTSSGNDNTGDGTSNLPWATISKANTLDLNPGDSVLFAGGQTFSGNLVLSAEDSGTKDAPVLLGSYGEGRATIDALNGSGILATNAGGIRINNLIVKGTGRPKNSGYGVRLVNNLPKAMKLDYVRIEHVEASGFGKEGISVHGAPEDTSMSGFGDVRIEHCVAHDNVYYGIHVSGSWNVAAKDYAHANVYIGHCTAYRNLGDPDFMDNHSGSGIFLNDTDGGTIEHCIAYENGELCHCKIGGPVGIWTHASNKITIQFCESYNNRTGGPCDGGGFDFDGGVTNSVLQYNYSHGNDGAGYLLYTYSGAPKTFKNNIMRFNISENDGRKNGYGGIYVGNDGSGVSELEIYHNTIYCSAAKGASPKAVYLRKTKDVRFRNNIFQTTGSVPLIDSNKEQPGLVFQGNAYWNSDDAKIIWNGKPYANLSDWRAASSQEKVDGKDAGMECDPKLIGVGAAVILGDTKKLGELSSYRLTEDSALRGAGFKLSVAPFNLPIGERDFYGSTLHTRNTFSIGAFQAPESAK
jgi:hypothetical protein